MYFILILLLLMVARLSGLSRCYLTLLLAPVMAGLTLDHTV
jgi:hypothetical protein